MSTPARVYYDGDFIHDGANPPARGVLAIVQDDPTAMTDKVEVVCCSDYYVMKDGRWHGADIFGLFDFLLDSGIVLFGRTIDKNEYQRITAEAVAERDRRAND